MVLLSSYRGIKVFITPTVCFKPLCGWAFIAQEWWQMDSPEEQSPRTICRTGRAQAARFIFLLCSQPALRRRRRALQSLCLLKGTTSRATCWGGGFGDVSDAPSRGFSQRLLANLALGRFLKHLLSWKWKQFFEQLLSIAWIHTKQALQLFDSSTYSYNTPFLNQFYPFNRNWWPVRSRSCPSLCQYCRTEYLLCAVP